MIMVVALLVVTASSKVLLSSNERVLKELVSNNSKLNFKDESSRKESDLRLGAAPPAPPAAPAVTQNNVTAANVIVNNITNAFEPSPAYSI